MRQADLVVLFDDEIRRYAEDSGVGPDRIFLSQDWTHAEPPHGDRGAIRRELGWDDYAVVVLHNVDADVKQDLDNVVAAARLLSDGGSGVKVVLTGDERQREPLQRLASEVPALGFLSAGSAGKVPDLLAGVDVLLVNEPTSSIDLNAAIDVRSNFRAGTPVLVAARANGATANEVARSGAGIVVPPEDSKALADGVLALASDQDLRRSLGRAARSYTYDLLASEAALAELASVVTGRS